MTLEELKEIIKKANETQHDDHNLNCGVCKAAADLSDMSRTALPAAIALIEQMAEALDKGIELLEPFQESGFLGDQALNKHRDSLAAYEAYKKNVGGE